MAEAMLSFSDLPITRPAWLEYKETSDIFAAIEAASGTARFVGGCVRDAILGKLSDDLDICTTLEPEAAMAALEQAGIRVVPTGIKHGTVTAILNKRVFEITTLRVDVESYGRHAKVAFTDDWKEDAARRDFTFNALYCDLDGAIYDYFGGIEDLNNGLVRFIGNAENRVQEDYLRILRFFRFSARFSAGHVDDISFQACEKYASKVTGLSRERITKEILLLLNTETPTSGLELMARSGVFEALFETLPDLAAANRLQALNGPETVVVKLAVLLRDAARALDVLRLSNAQVERLEWLLSSVDTQFDFVHKELGFYRYGIEPYVDAACYAHAKFDVTVNVPELVDFANNFEIPSFPVKGKDLLAHGIKAGPTIGETLSKLEGIWIRSGFKLSKDDLLKHL